MRRFAWLAALLVVGLTSCNMFPTGQDVNRDVDEFEVGVGKSVGPFQARFKRFESVWDISHFSERICTGGTRLVAGVRVDTEGSVGRVGRSVAGDVSYAWDWAQPAAGMFTPSHAPGASATILDTPYAFAVDPFQTTNPLQPVCNPVVTATGALKLTRVDGQEVHGIVTGGEVYEITVGSIPGGGQEQFVKVSITGGTGRFEFASGEFVVHNIFDFVNDRVLMSETLDGGTLIIPEPHEIDGRVRNVDINWVVSHFSEQICTQFQSLVAGSEVVADARLHQLGNTDVDVSAAWDWSAPAQGRFTPEGPRAAQGSSASVLGAYPYAFAVDPFATANPLQPVCGNAVSATGAVVLASRRGKIFGVVTGGEVYELSFGRFPGDGQEQFITVEITGGTGRYTEAVGRFVFHAIFNFGDVNALFVEGEILDGGRVAF